MNNIKFVVFDFDGVFTDGKCYFTEDNKIKKFYNIKDGMALSILKNSGIKTGLISSYSTEKSILINEEKVNNSIITHLKFDYSFIGKSNKLEILQSWLTELNYNFDNVAYIGDDINDLEIIKKVKFSACPNDAVIECKQIVNYVCERKGGDGCVREFIDLIIKNDFENNIIKEIRDEINYQLDNISMDKIKELVEIISNCKGIIYTTGIGKSENIAIHFSNLLKSISIKGFFLNATNALHGDIGILKQEDIVIFFSKSGKTNELLTLFPFIKERKVYKIGICNDVNNEFNNCCDYILCLPLKEEIKGTIDKIPTNSYMSHLLFSNIIISELKKNIKLDDYKKNHPAGEIGNNLKKIKDCLIILYPKIVFKDKIKLHDVLLEMTNYKIGCCFFTDEKEELLGIVTDGDIRRLLVTKSNIEFIEKENLNTNYYYENNLDKFIKDIEKIHNYIPIVINKKIIGIIKN